MVSAAAGVEDSRGAGVAAVGDGGVTAGCEGVMYEARVRWCDLGRTHTTARRSGMYGGGRFQRGVGAAVHCVVLLEHGCQIPGGGWVASCW